MGGETIKKKDFSLQSKAEWNQNYYKKTEWPIS